MEVRIAGGEEVLLAVETGRRGSVLVLTIAVEESKNSIHRGRSLGASMVLYASARE